MNKKFFTLIASAFVVAGSFQAAAQSSHGANGEITYRTHLTKSANLDAGLWEVNKINGEKWYQLRVQNPSVTTNAMGKQETFVLTQERDYKTGHIYLAVKPIQEAVLTHSLWKLEFVKDGNPAGWGWKFKNKETGYYLTMDHTRALTYGKDFVDTDFNVVDDLTLNSGGPDVYRLDGGKFSPTILDGCNEIWSWYTDNDISGVPGASFDPELISSYFHDQDSVMALAFVGVPDKGAITWDGAGDGSTDTGEGRSYIAAVKFHSNQLNSLKNGSFLNNSAEALLHIQVVNAGAKVLNADEINSMIDADGNELLFEQNSAYAPDYTFTNATINKIAKFTIYDPVTKATVYQNPFEGATAFTAEESPYKQLVRTNYGPNVPINSVDMDDTDRPDLLWAGYNILFKNGAGNSYLTVLEKLYEGTEPAMYNGLIVTSAPYAYRIGAVNNVADLAAEREEILPADLPGTGTNMDALQARYHWKVTYYPTNDSVVFEPLNASRMTVEETRADLDFVKSKVGANWTQYFFNTINEGVAYSSAGADAPKNSMYNKAPGVPVALYLMNTAPGADAVKLLTIGVPSQYDSWVPNYAAVCKFDEDPLDYNTIEYCYVANPTYQVANDNPAYVTNKFSVLGLPNVDYVADMKMRLTFDNKYSWLKRTSLTNGMYFIQLAYDDGTNTNRIKDMYLVENHWGQMMWDSQTKYQDYMDMPATMWVVKQLYCEDDQYQKNKTPKVAIYNREYGKKGTTEYPVFVGQLYEDEEGNTFFIDHSNIPGDHQYMHDTGTGKFLFNYLSCGDVLKFTEIKKADNTELYDDIRHGYKHFDRESLTFTSFHLNYLRTVDYQDAPNLDYFLNVNTKDSIFNVSLSGSIVFEVDSLYEVDYGYTYDPKELAQLKRTIYSLKVQDQNHVDNDWEYVTLATNAYNGQQNAYYKMHNLEDVEGVYRKLAKFYFKADKRYDGEASKAYSDKRGFVLVDANGPIAGPDYKLEDWLTFQGDLLAVFAPNTINTGDFFNNTYAPRQFVQNGYRMLHVTDSEANARPKSLNTGPTDRTSAFMIADVDRPKYMPIGKEVRDVNGNIKIYSQVGNITAAKRYLFEDSHNQSRIGKDAYEWKPGEFGFLGITYGTKGAADALWPIDPSTVALYADSVVSSQIYMPQYLFFVAPDSIKDGWWCITNQHGYFPTEAAGDIHDKTHYDFYNGYVAGRVLVNLNDSIYKYNGDRNQAHVKARDKFRYEKYTALAFVDAVHMFISEKNENAIDESGSKFSYEYNGKALTGEWLFIFEGGLKLKDVYADQADWKMPDSEHKYIDPDKFQKGINDGYIIPNILNGDHQNYAFSLRYLDYDHKRFFMETQSYDLDATKAGYKGAWIKVQNEVPVLAQTSTSNGIHDKIMPNDELTLTEAIGQGGIFYIEKTEEKATSNEDVQDVAKVKVIASQGKVTILGAAGKKVAISNVLGQAIATGYISNDNYSIDVPAGMVIVAVEGESAVKAVVK